MTTLGDISKKTVSGEAILGGTIPRKVRVEHFVPRPELRTYYYPRRPAKDDGCGNARSEEHQHSLELMLSPEVFSPSAHGLFLLDHLVVHPGERVIDIGTGTGIFAIAAASVLGTRVSATDISDKAIALAEDNARRNGVIIHLSVGSYFSQFNEKYDLIIANLPQEIIPSTYRSAIGEELASTISGGEEGTAQMLELLDVAQEHMHQNSHLLMMVYSVSNYRDTIQKILANYTARIVAMDEGPVKEFVEDNAAEYWKLNQEGKISIFQKGSRIYASVFLLELILK